MNDDLSKHGWPPPGYPAKPGDKLPEYHVRNPGPPRQSPTIHVTIEWPPLMMRKPLAATLEVDDCFAEALERLSRNREIDPMEAASAMRQAMNRKTMFRALAQGLADRLLTLVESNDTKMGYEPEGGPPAQKLEYKDLGELLAGLILADPKIYQIVGLYPGGRSILHALMTRVDGVAPSLPQTVQDLTNTLL